MSVVAESDIEYLLSIVHESEAVTTGSLVFSILNKQKTPAGGRLEANETLDQTMIRLRLHVGLVSPCAKFKCKLTLATCSILSRRAAKRITNF